MTLLEDPEMDEIEERARKAGYRAPLVDTSARKADRIDIDAPLGVYPIDALAQKLSKKRIRGGECCTDDLWKLDEPHKVVRAMICDNHDLGATWTSFRKSARDQAPRDAAAIAAKIGSLMADIQAFIDHSPVDADTTPADNQPSFENTRTALKSAYSHLEELQSARKEFERRSSLEDLEMNTFLVRMTFSYASLTGRIVGKTNAGLFIDFCICAWQTYGWPGDETKIRKSFANRIGRGVHLDLGKPY